MSQILYTLINKETPLCDFVIEGEGELEICKIVKEYKSLPFWCEPLSTLISFCKATGFCMKLTSQKRKKL